MEFAPNTGILELHLPTHSCESVAANAIGRFRYIAPRAEWEYGHSIRRPLSCAER